METTSARILEVAHDLAQARGFAGFSYADIAATIGIRKASIHYHYPAKTDLGLALLKRYRHLFQAGARFIAESGGGARAQLELALVHYQREVGAQHLCLCGALSAAVNELSEEMINEIRGFFTDLQALFSELLEAGNRSGDWRVSDPVTEAASLVSTLEGAMLLSRAHNDADFFRRVMGSRLEQLTGS